MEPVITDHAEDVCLAWSERATAGGSPAQLLNGELKMSDYARHPGHKCPTCDSPAPHLHPAVQCDGEVEICADTYHLTPTNQNLAVYIREVHEKRAAV